MEKFNFLVFIDDDHPSNVYHEIVLDDSQLCEESLFFISSQKGFEYFEELSKQKAPKIPDILFLDINMPYMDGWEFLEKFQHLNFAVFPKVIMLSSSNYPKDKERGKAFPLVYTYIEKPLNENVLRTILHDLLHGS